MPRQYSKRRPGDIIGDGGILVERVNTRLWKIRCKCGNVFINQPSDSSGRCWECSHKYVSGLHIKHNESPRPGRNASRLYRIWTGARNRCNNPNNHGFSEYGDRGISMCSEWDDYQKFKEWALNNGYEDWLSLDRRDNDGPYSPENCRWATQSQQMRNTRVNHLLTHDGETHTLVEWSEITGIPYHTLKQRINTYGWNVERALETR